MHIQRKLLGCTIQIRPYPRRRCSVSRHAMHIWSVLHHFFGLLLPNAVFAPRRELQWIHHRGFSLCDKLSVAQRDLSASLSSQFRNVFRLCCQRGWCTIFKPMCADTLPQSITRNLSNTLYVSNQGFLFFCLLCVLTRHVGRWQEKRKIGALEVEQLVKDLRAQGDLVKLKRMILYLTDNYAYSANGNAKKGGLIALAAVVIGLQQDTYRFLHLIIPPMLKVKQAVSSCFLSVSGPLVCVSSRRCAVHYRCSSCTWSPVSSSACALALDP